MERNLYPMGHLAGRLRIPQPTGAGPSKSWSEPSFLLMPHGKDRQNVAIHTITSDVPGISEIDEPFPVLLGHILDEASYMGMRTKDAHAFENSFACPLGD
ncbi:hypothetical protein GGE45_001816 [Rhizobium aethiopicum]|nr:hypothetical protein [Rhizobium aethiopicum]